MEQYWQQYLRHFSKLNDHKCCHSYKLLYYPRMTALSEITLLARKIHIQVYVLDPNLPDSIHMLLKLTQSWQLSQHPQSLLSLFFHPSTECTSQPESTFSCLITLCT